MRREEIETPPCRLETASSVTIFIIVTICISVVVTIGSDLVAVDGLDLKTSR